MPLICARDYFEDVSRAVREHRRAELLLEFGPEPGAGGGPCDPSAGGPVVARLVSDEMARESMRATEAAIGEALGRIEELRRIFSRKADAVELHYVDLLPWDAVAERLGRSRRTAIAWRDEMFDWIDSIGWARLRGGVGFAEDVRTVGGG